MKKNLNIIFICFALNGFAQLEFTENYFETEEGRITVAIDLDKDGDIDFLTHRYNPDEFIWYKNDGNQNFTKTVINNDFIVSGSISPIDFDNDGDIDIVAKSTFYNNKIALYTNDGNQNFTSSDLVNISTGNFDNVLVGDLNNDNFYDLIAIEGMDFLVSYVNDGNNNFQRQVIDNEFQNSHNLNFIYLADLDGNNRLDVVNAAQTKSLLTWYEQDNTGLFVKTVLENTVSGIYLANPVDIDNDNDLDLIVGSSVDDSIYWYKNSNATFAQGNLNLDVSAPFYVDTADMNNDGFEDIISMNFNNEERYVWFDNAGNQNFTRYPISELTLSHILDIKLVDIDSDGDIDMVLDDFTGNRTYWLENNYTAPIEGESPIGKCYDEFENRNWISNCSFDLKGRLTSSGISYYNAMGKATQTQSTDIKTGRVWAGQTMYDFHDRASFQSLSAPVDSINYGYKNFVLKANGDPLTTADVESILEENTALPVISDQENTLGWYYSENNSREPYQDITSHPYSKSIYSKLNPGTVLKTIGGNKVTIEGEEKWLNNYSFSMPVAQELFYAFGVDHFPIRVDLNAGQGFSGSAFCTISPIDDPMTFLKVKVTNANNTTLDVNAVYEFILPDSQSGNYRLVNVTYEDALIQQIIDLCSNSGNNFCPPGVVLNNLNAAHTILGQVKGPSGIPYYINATKTINRNVHGIETVVFVDSNGNTLAAARSGNEDGRAPIPYEVVSTIGEQGFVDIHIPVGVSGNVSFEGMDDIQFRVYDLITETEVTTTPILVGNSYTLSPGMYRIEEITDRVKMPSYVTIDGTGSIILIDETLAAAVRYDVNYYDYSLNYYDKASRLLKSVQPLGFDDKFSLSLTPNHTFISTFDYNTIGQLQESISPDEGQVVFKYRKDGQIRFSQNSKQAAAVPQEFSYTNYDNHGRSIESGIVLGYDFDNADPDDDTILMAEYKEQQFTRYDEADISGLHTALVAEGIPIASYPTQNFVAGNVSQTFTESPSTTTTWYSYDVYGRVEWLVQYINALGTKTIDYEYDQTSGEVTKVCYQKYVPAEMFIHKYTYNIAGQLTDVATSTDNINFIDQANYQYYEMGALKRTELGNNIQGIDYTYNLAGQLKAINSPNLGATDPSIFNDPGKDGTFANTSFPKDAFGMTLDYYNGDYLRSNLPSNLSTTAGGTNQYNGNIKAQAWGTNVAINAGPSAYFYEYNKNNWLENAGFSSYDQLAATAQVVETFATIENTSKTVVATESIVFLPGFETAPDILFEAKITEPIDSTPDPESDYDVTGLSYDANGNLLSLNRNKDTEDNSNAMDKLSYEYKDGKNQLDRVIDDVTEITNANDIKTQETNNYTYNEIGQLVNNSEEGISYSYNASGLVTEIQKDNLPLVKFYYNDKGYRVRKESFNNGALSFTDHYVRDASRSTVAIYRNGVLTEQPIYGTDRIGVAYRNGGTSYELTDHLGNVRAVIGSEIIKTLPPQNSINGTSDYYPFGMPMPNRYVTDGNYRYAYQGQEKDSETGNEAFELRLWDSRIGRWLTADPLGEFSSPYLGMGNNPISNIDPNGGMTDCPDCPTGSAKVNIWDSSDGNTYDFVNGEWKPIVGFLKEIVIPTKEFKGDWQEYQQWKYNLLHQAEVDRYMKEVRRRNKEWHGAYAIALAPLAIIAAIEATPAITAKLIYAKTARVAGEIGTQSVGQLLNNGEITLEGYNEVNIAASLLPGTKYVHAIKSGVKYEDGEVLYLGNGITLSDFAINYASKRATKKVHGSFKKYVKEAGFNATQEFILDTGSKTVINSSYKYFKNYYSD